METTLILSEFRNAAYAAYSGISFSPEKRAEQTIKDYSQELSKDLETLSEASEETRQRYIEKYKSAFSSWLGSMSRIYSVMIAGPAKFPVKRMEKYNNWEQRKYEAFRLWRERAIKAITREPQKSQPEQLEEQKAKLEKLKRNHEMMKQANKILRSKSKDKHSELVSIGFGKSLADEFLSQNTVFTFELSNNLANIKRIEDRVKEMETKLERAETIGQAEYDFKENESLNEAGKVVINYELNRLQIVFENRPSAQTCQTLKKHGFKWAPSQSAWQRILTGNALYSTEQLTGTNLRKKPVLATT